MTWTAERFNYIHSDYNVQVIKDNVVSWNTDYRKKKQSFEFTWYEVKCISTVINFVQANVTAVTLRVSFSNTLKKKITKLSIVKTNNFNAIIVKKHIRNITTVFKICSHHKTVITIYKFHFHVEHLYSTN